MQWICVQHDVASRQITLDTCFVLLGRLLRVDLIKWVSNVRMSVRPQKVSSISMKFGM